MNSFSDEPNERQCLMPNQTKKIRWTKMKWKRENKKSSYTHREARNERTSVRKMVKESKKNSAENWINCNGNCVCIYVYYRYRKKGGIEFLGLPPVTRHVNTMSSPSSIGPSIVPFNWWPHRFNTNGYSGGTKRFKRGNKHHNHHHGSSISGSSNGSARERKKISKKNDTKE